jgi:hypothetical protein
MSHIIQCTERNARVPSATTWTEFLTSNRLALAFCDKILSFVYFTNTIVISRLGVFPRELDSIKSPENSERSRIDKKFNADGSGKKELPPPPAMRWEVKLSGTKIRGYRKTCGEVRLMMSTFAQTRKNERIRIFRFIRVLYMKQNATFSTVDSTR